MPDSPPSVVVIAGPNGAGKSTAAPLLIGEVLGVTHFVNADVIAHGLSAFDPEGAAIAAGRIMLGRLKELAAARESFAFETTLASRTFAPWISRLVEEGYEFHLIFAWLPSPEMAIERVADRVASGGHHVAEDVVRRRYQRGLTNFNTIYRPIAAVWRVYDNSGRRPRLIAEGTGSRETSVVDAAVWGQIQEFR